MLTNLRARFSVATLKVSSSAAATASALCLLAPSDPALPVQLAMIKTQTVAEQLFGGRVYDCVCMYEPPSQQQAAV